MANKEIVNVITIKTEQSQNTIKGLRTEISNLKKDLENAEIGSEKFEQASRDLAKAQADLKTVLTDGKKATDAVDGSYNHLVATMAELKKQWKATADEVKRNELGQQIDNINTQLKDLDATIGNNQRNVGNYAEDFKKALAEQDDATIGTRTKLEGLQKVTAGLASGYAAFQGVTALLGIENENLEKTFVKVQAAMAIAQGVGGMKDLIEGAGRLKVAFKGATSGVKTFIGGLSGVKKAIAATGIGLLVVALGTMVAYWDDVTAAVKRWTGAMDNGGKKVDEILSKQGKLSTNAARMQKELNRELAIMKAEGKSDLEIAQKKLELSEQIYNEQKGYVESLEKQYNYSKWQKDNGVPLTDFAKGVLEKYPEMIEKGKELTESYRQNWLDVLNEIKVINILTAKGTSETITSGLEDADDELNEVKTIAERARKSLIDTKEEELAELKRIYDEEKLLLEKHGEDTVNLTDEYNLKVQEIEQKYNIAKEDALRTMKEDSLTDEELDYLKLKEQYDSYIDLFKEEKETLLLIEEWYEQERTKIQEKYNPKESEETTETPEKTPEEYIDEYGAIFQWIRKQSNNTAAYIAIGFTQALSSASQIISELQSNIDTTSEDGFEKNKKMQKAQAWMNVAQGIISAVSSAMQLGPIIGPIVGAINAAAVATLGAIQVANINKQKYDGDSPIGDTGAAVTPNVNLGDSMPITYTRELLTDTETSNLNREQRVYVLENDISDVQNNVKVKENNSSF